jgi:hypothetical protein
MPPVWKPNEAEANIYDEVENHSDGMISFTYHPPSQRDLENLQDTQTYRSAIEENISTQIISPKEKGSQEA